jgi:uncharacterized protein YaaR (DUF327 family)
VRKIEKKPSFYFTGNQGQINISFDQSQIYATQSQNQNDLKELKEIIAQFLPYLRQSSISDEEKKEIEDLLDTACKQKEQGNVDRGIISRINEKLGKFQHMFTASSAATGFVSMIMDILKS